MNQKFPKPIESVKLTVDVVVFTVVDGHVMVLVTKRTNAPHLGEYSLPGGFLWQDETSIEAAKRNLYKKTGVTCDYIEQLYTFDDPKRDARERVISVSYLALLRQDQFNAADLAAHDAILVPAVKAGKLPFDHSDIVAYALSRLRSKLSYTNVAFALLPAVFTFSDLQETYEAILGKSLDKRNFRKKIAATDLIKPTNQKQTGARHRPAMLYKFSTNKPTELELPIY